jgi:hypothetical protein
VSFCGCRDGQLAGWESCGVSELEIANRPSCATTSARAAASSCPLSIITQPSLNIDATLSIQLLETYGYTQYSRLSRNNTFPTRRPITTFPTPPRPYPPPSSSVLPILPSTTLILPMPLGRVKPNLLNLPLQIPQPLFSFLHANRTHAVQPDTVKGVHSAFAAGLEYTRCCLGLGSCYWCGRGLLIRSSGG